MKTGTRAVNFLRRLQVYKLEPVRRLLSSPHCLCCELPTATELLCEGCKADLPWNLEACPGCAIPSTRGLPCPACLRRPRRFDAAWAPFRLAPPVRLGILGLKYAARFEQARLLGGLMAEGLQHRGGASPDLLLPVPLHWRRLISRGYNQAQLLAREIGRALDIELDVRSLRRVHATPDQIGRSASERRHNLRKAFELTRRLDGLHVAIVDDVMTTGATFDELARVCRKAGALRIEAWAAARTP
ncbi:MULTISPECIES: ComF family protein [Hydrocarboniphaga]|uniref:Uncharacterized protein n=1 Tax=Hydrocarboniphaga effusa AP103 TaxID=1172194 RepID=I7ZHQ4_9GAMM|nr:MULTISPECIES: ComF family protein [Hydrocarboniphaga]EIT71277.1 hypothetical protein WQQ_14140 [Hydrocarboniphaga effusa AP103]MDZ4077758.1 ComF family protein [Hydrocarboniphaga sp.]